MRIGARVLHADLGDTNVKLAHVRTLRKVLRGFMNFICVVSDGSNLSVQRPALRLGCETAEVAKHGAAGGVERGGEVTLQTADARGNLASNGVDGLVCAGQHAYAKFGGGQCRLTRLLEASRCVFAVLEGARDWGQICMLLNCRRSEIGLGKSERQMRRHLLCFSVFCGDHVQAEEN